MSSSFYILSSNSKNNWKKLEINLNIKKFLSKFFKKAEFRFIRKTTQSIFVSVYPPSSCPKFVYEFEFFPSNSLGGTFLDKGDSKVCEVENFMMGRPGVHGKCGVFPLFF